MIFFFFFQKIITPFSPRVHLFHLTKFTAPNIITVQQVSVWCKCQRMTKTKIWPSSHLWSSFI